MNQPQIAATLVLGLGVPVLLCVLPWIVIGALPLYGRYLDWVACKLESWGLKVR